MAIPDGLAGATHEYENPYFHKIEKGLPCVVAPPARCSEEVRPAGVREAVVELTGRVPPHPAPRYAHYDGHQCIDDGPELTVGAIVWR